VVTGSEHARVRALFKDLVPDDVLAAYDRLLAAGGCPKDEAEAFAGGKDRTQALTDRGMAHVLPHSPAGPAQLQAAPPDLALQGVLVDLQTRLLRGQELLLDGHHRLAGAQAWRCADDAAQIPGHLVKVMLDRAEISERSAALINTARKDWMTLENLDTEMPLTADFAQASLPGFRGRVRCRSIYAAEVMDHPVGRRLVHTCAEAGEQARLLPDVPMKMKLADRTAALLPLTPAGTVGALLIRAPVITAALREYFELLWEKGNTHWSKTACGGAAGTRAADRPGAAGRRPAR
jgi:hypothetical protein